MKEAGLIWAFLVKRDGGDVTKAGGQRLTRHGHDHLDAIRHEAVWAKTKTMVRETVGSVTFDVMKTIAGHIAIKMIGLGA